MAVLCASMVDICKPDNIVVLSCVIIMVSRVYGCIVYCTKIENGGHNYLFNNLTINL